jgi:hypothetical protein
MMIQVLLIAMLGIVSSVAFAEQPDDAAKTQAMLGRAVAALKADRAAAIDMFTNGAAGFRDGNIYVFCFERTSGKLLTGQNPGKEVQTIRGSNGDPWGLRIFNASQKPAGEVTELSYLAPKPGPDPTEVLKVTVVTAADEQFACGVGYYP